MNIDEIRAAVGVALRMRPPRFEQGAGGAEKISALEDYLLESAYMQAELEEARHYLTYTVETLKQQIAEMTGYEALLPAKSQDRLTEADRNHAKAQAAPELFAAGKEARMLLETVKRQVERFRFEAGQGPISRAYTLITGG